MLLVPLSTSPSLRPFINRIGQKLRTLGIACRTDNSNVSIGKRYARNDELGTPLGITIDFDTVKDGSVTLRERDSMDQVRGHEEEIIQAVRNLIDETETWNDISGRLPKFVGTTVV